MFDWILVFCTWPGKYALSVWKYIGLGSSVLIQVQQLFSFWKWVFIIQNLVFCNKAKRKVFCPCENKGSFTKIKKKNFVHDQDKSLVLVVVNSSSTLFFFFIRSPDKKRKKHCHVILCHNRKLQNVYWFEMWSRMDRGPGWLNELGSYRAWVAQWVR